MSFDLKIENGNLAIQNGDFKQVTDSEKLIQDILKISLTDAGSNRLHPWYGSFITKNIIGSAQDFSLLVDIGKSQLQSALENLKTLQEIQVGAFQNMSSDEQLLSVLNIKINHNVYDPRQIEIELSVLTKGRKPVSTSFSINI